jgi:hypothetical protein
MATINNTSLFKELRDGAKSYGTEKIPNKIADKVVPVMEVNPKLLRIIDTGFSATGTASTTATTLTTLPSEARDFYLCGGSFTFAKDATCDVATGTVTFIGTSNSASIIFARLATITLTADNQGIAFVLPFPCKLDRGTTIYIGSGTHTAGTFVRAASCYGFFVNNPNG